MLQNCNVRQYTWIVRPGGVIQDSIADCNAMCMSEGIFEGFHLDEVDLTVLFRRRRRKRRRLQSWRSCVSGRQHATKADAKAKTLERFIGKLVGHITALEARMGAS